MTFEQFINELGVDVSTGGMSPYRIAEKAWEAGQKSVQQENAKLREALEIVSNHCNHDLSQLAKQALAKKVP